MKTLVKKRVAYEESFQQNAVRVDREKGVIYNVLVVGRKARNKRRYSDEAMEAAVAEGIYENLQVYLGPHKKKGTPQFKKRSPDEHIGELRGLYKAKDGLRARELHVNRESKGGRIALEVAERFPNSFGLSHHVDYDGYVEGDETIVTRILEAHVVDMVKDPGTTDSIFEDHEMADEAVEEAGDTAGETQAEVTTTDDSGGGDWKSCIKDLIAAIHDDDTIDDDVKVKATKKAMDLKKMLSGDGDAETETEEEEPVGEEEVDVKALAARLDKLEKRPEPKRVAPAKPKSTARKVATEEADKPKPVAQPKKREDILAAYDVQD